MSTATIAGACGAAKTSTKRRQTRTAPSSPVSRTKTAIQPPGQPSSPATHGFSAASIIRPESGTHVAPTVGWRRAEEAARDEDPPAPKCTVYAGLKCPCAREGE